MKGNRGYPQGLTLKSFLDMVPSSSADFYHQPCVDVSDKDEKPLVLSPREKNPRRQNWPFLDPPGFPRPGLS